MSSTGVTQTRVYLPSLAAELPDGWTVSERSVFTSPSGVDVRVQLSRAPEGWDASDLIDEAARREQAVLADVEEISASTIELRGGRSGLERRFGSIRDGISTVGRIVCAVDGGRALTVSASWPVTDDSANADGAIDLLLNSLRLLDRPVATVAALREPVSEHDPKKRARRQPPEWSALRAAWSGSSPPQAELRDTSRWSPEELAVCATVLGSPQFPTVGIELLAALPEATLDATLQAVTRSFIARGLIRAGDDGSAVLVGGIGEMMETAVYPDLTITMEHVGSTGRGARWLGTRGDTAVQVVILPDGSRECGALESACLLGHVFACATAVADGADGAVVETGTSLSTVTLAEVIDGTGPIVSLVFLNTAWRVGEQIWGGVLTWAVGADGSLWSTEQHQTDEEAPMSWSLRTADVDAMRSELLEHLPGA